MDVDKVGGWFEVTNDMLEDFDLGMTLVEKCRAFSKKQEAYHMHRQRIAKDY